MTGLEKIEPLAEDFLSSLWIEDGLAKNTLSAYRADLEAFIQWLKKSNVGLLSVQQGDISAYLAVKQGYFSQSPFDRTQTLLSLGAA